MIGIRSLRRVFALFAISLLATVAGSFFAPHPAQAEGETYTWKSYNQIEVKGGDFKGTSTLTLNPNGNISGDQSAVFVGTFLINKGGAQGCEVVVSFYLFKSLGNEQGVVFNPPPYDEDSVGPIDGPPTCYFATGKSDAIDKQYANKQVTIGGTRPTDPNDTTENEEDKQAIITILAPDPQSKAPKNVTITIKQGDKVIATQTVPFEDDSGAADWPPDQTPVGARATFAGLEPGVYIVCDNYVIKNCETFTKEKGKIFSETYGKQFETPDKKMIDVHVAYNTVRPCGASIEVQPVTITLIGPDGKTTTKQTNGRTNNPEPDETGKDCNVNVTLGLDALFENMPPGNYEACTTGADCVKFIKKPGEKAEVTLTVETTLQPPADQKVCSAGEGIAGVFALFVCPFTEVAAKATEFFQNSIIIPFMTVSPLTTNADNPIYILWQSFRNLANIGFIIFFFFIVFSQATSIGISRYGLKRMLSRVAVVVIGVNLSYFAAALAIDGFNVFGAGLSNLVTSAIQEAGTTQLENGTDATPLQSVFVLGGTALVGILLSGGAILGWLFSLIMLAMLILVIAILILLLRQVLIVMLVIIAPIAILLYMLPNTENYFQRWRKLFVKLLIMYPMIVLLFASGKIFGMILQQPGLIQTGGGISDEAAEAIRVILQFIVYILPLAFLPATFAASGTIMSRGYSWASNRFVRPRAQKAREDASLMGAEARARLASSKVPGISQVAGRKYTRDYNRESRSRNVTEAQNEYLAEAYGAQTVLGGLRRRGAAGVGGQAGRTSAAAAAAQVAEKSRSEDLKAENALLQQEMRRLGMDEDTFAEKTAAYLEDPTNQANRTITGANGQTFNFASNETRLQRALLNSAASQGYVRALEAARTNENIDQSMVDDIIRRNDGTLKGKGGYHLATNFGLAAGRMQVRDQATGQLRAPNNKHEMETEIKAQRLIAMSQTGLDSIAGMKTGTVVDSGQLLGTPGAARDDILRAMDHAAAAETARRRQSDPAAAAVDYRAALRDKMDDMLSPRMRQTIAKSDNEAVDFQNIRDGL